MNYKIDGMKLEGVFNTDDTDKPQRVQNSPLFLVVQDSTTARRPKRRWFEKDAFSSLMRARRDPGENPDLKYTAFLMPKDKSRRFARPQPWMLPDSVQIPFIRSVDPILKDEPIPQNWIIPDGVKIPSIRIPENHLYSDDLTPIDLQEKNLFDNPSVVSTVSKRYWMQPGDVKIAPPEWLERPLTKRDLNKIRTTLSQHSNARVVGCQNKRKKRTSSRSLYLSQVLPLKPRMIMKTIPAKLGLLGRQSSKVESLRNQMCPNGGYSCTWKEAGKK